MHRTEDLVEMLQEGLQGVAHHELIFVVTRKGHAAIQRGAHRYTRAHRCGAKAWWRCSKKSSNGCRSSITTIDTPFFVKTNRGNTAIQMGGFRYLKANRTAAWVRWRCSKKDHGCAASVKTFDGKIISMSGEHNHAEPHFISYYNE
ncbi:hypothetical protein JYU34_004424 [Plutella xylostella]|uniref:FLYWCH-type domain-containing protein n=1 Tax=Plutella xylostella TaxID=51655 RepID=A0ABQ7QXY5_PLUXY|nr:hypothetical protein JYU34_004424 [Plutella xylostella]